MVWARRLGQGDLLASCNVALHRRRIEPQQRSQPDTVLQHVDVRRPLVALGSGQIGPRLADEACDSGTVPLLRCGVDAFEILVRGREGPQLQPQGQVLRCQELWLCHSPQRNPEPFLGGERGIRLHDGEVVLLDMVQNRPDQARLVLEVIVDQPHSDAGLLGNCAHGHPRDSLSGQQVRDCLENPGLPIDDLVVRTFLSHVCNSRALLRERLAPASRATDPRSSTTAGPRSSSDNDRQSEYLPRFCHDAAMATMKAAVLTAHGGPEVLQLRNDWPRPEPGASEVLVRVVAAAVNNTDIWTREGAYGVPGNPNAKAGWRGPVAFPRVQGGDIAGVIADVGRGVDAGRVGERVLVDPALYRDHAPEAPPDGLLGSEADGGFAEYVTVSAERAHDMTASPLSDEELATLPVAYGTAMGMLERARISAGETVVVTGASGGVGLALVQLAAARNAHVIAITSGNKAAAVLSAGASHTVDRHADDLVAHVQQHSKGGLDAVADVVGGPQVAELMPLIRDDGRWVIAGAIAGPVVELDLRRLYLHNIRLIGSSMHTRAHFATLVDAARTGTVRPVIAARYLLDDVHIAQDQFRQGEHAGKIVVFPSSPTAS